MHQDQLTGEMVRELEGGLELRLIEGIAGNALLTLGDPRDDGPTDIWTYRTLYEALKDFTTWEPGIHYFCAACQTERVSVCDPLGAWIRHQPSNRRRLPIVYSPGGLVLGWMHYKRG